MGTTIGLTGAAEPVALQSDLEALQAQVTTLAAEVKALQGGVTPPPTETPSPTDTFITAVGQPAIIDDKLNAWTLVTATAPATGAQIALNGKVDPPTQNVSTLGIQLVSNVRTVVQKNAAGDCYENPTAALGAWVAFGGPVPP